MLHDTRVTGCAAVSEVGVCRAGEPGSMPSARQIAVYGSMPAALPCTTGRRQSRASPEQQHAQDEERAPQPPRGIGFAGPVGRRHRGQPRAADAVDDRARRGLNDELRDRPPIGREHQDQHQHVPQPEAVERFRDPRRRVQRQRIADRRRSRSRLGPPCSRTRLKTNSSALASSITPPKRLTTTHGPHQAISGSL